MALETQAVNFRVQGDYNLPECYRLPTKLNEVIIQKNKANNLSIQ
jgi:hypothetical protein